MNIRAIQAVIRRSVCRTGRQNLNYREALCVEMHLHKAFGVLLLNKLKMQNIAGFTERMECLKKKKPFTELLKYLLEKDTLRHTDE